MSFLFRRSKRGSKTPKHGLPGTMMNEKKSTAGHHRPHSRDDKKKQAPSAKLANQSLVTKINEKPTNPIPDVIASHDVPDGASDMKMATDGINHITDVKKENYEILSPQASHSAASNSKVNLGTSKIDDSAKVQIHHPPFEAAAVTSVESNLHIPGDERKRKSSITHSENEALGTLDEVVRTFEDFDENFNEVESPEKKQNELKPYPSYSDPPYETVEDLRKSLMDTHKIKREHELDNTKPSYSQTTRTISLKHAANELIPPGHEEPVYAKPVRPLSNNSSTKKEKGLDPPKAPFTRPAVPEKSPIVPPKRFEVQEDIHGIKFSALRKTSPSSSLSQSLHKTNWANANEDQSPKRKPVEDKNSNFVLRRGQLSGPAPTNTDETYVEPPRDYDINGALSSIGGSTTISDDSFTRDIWGSLTSSSTSGSRKVKKELRPEALKMIEKSKAVQDEKKDTEERHHDGLVNRSFKMIKKASLKESTSKSSLKSENTSQSDIESDYTNIKIEADRWLANYERLRANSEGKKGSVKSSSGTRKSVAPNVNEQKSTLNVENGLPWAPSLPLSETPQSKDFEVASGSLAATETSEEDQATNVKKELNEVKSRNDLNKSGENSSSDDENLIRLMETGFTEEDSTDSSPTQSERLRYVPRAMRMSFGHSWEGIRKDRREWKSREMKHTTSLASRKGGKSLSNRLDDQEPKLEMLF